ncbi:selenocysteine-specific translation elongation factor [Cloacibacillus evryensis]|uniref:selenocysteine-specific translation elongation factor n=1 Tax=Cloacibacillus evryensis TaxID=508460 RepID=UPI000240DB8B|nr:selenocysteine-specific translation elongation factor [Cloacibacillus evryensis]EHL66005.1 selenocysteine-specific translation elongation factor [Synergistes sp. 3_1_syn1]EXG78951.1 selenocysteine-specific elongation factor SelB [Cloacibacillus evryensis DSM 19522]MCQ4763339.1 selenocysteine-specific translation elongation factor [Cloacibacillus evryensis]MEA5035781.1 selenocysteine-specific translation elongation factor [Cloacibacillus evryensis]
MANNEYPFVIGTAGHIDHGKTTLVKRLTDVDCDRLAEEKKRGMTIELGFAPFTLPSGQTISIVDVPGHEKFIRQMVAGAAGVDAVMLVIAADDGVMPQTREHLAILSLLGIKNGLTVINKIDLVDEEMLEMAVDDAKSLLADTFLADKPVIPVSAYTGAGIEELKKALQRMTETADAKSRKGAFFLPVDRAFHISGFGTVVTGTAINGEVREGDEVEVMPRSFPSKVRSIQVHGAPVSVATAGQRVAVNLAGISLSDVGRGDVVTAKDCFTASKCLDVSIRLLPSAEPLKHWQRLRLHVGTTDTVTRVSLLDREQILPGESAAAQLITEDPVVASMNSCFILRTYSPLVTVAGGKILMPAGERPKNRQSKTALLEYLDRLSEEPQLKERLLALINYKGLINAADAARMNEINIAELMRALSPLEARGEIGVIRGGSAVLLSKGKMEELGSGLAKALASFHREHPERKGMPAEECAKAIDLQDTKFTRELLTLFEKQGVIKFEDERARLANFEPFDEELFSANVTALKKYAVKMGYSMPSVEEAQAALGFTAEEMKRIIAYLKEKKELALITGAFLLFLEIEADFKEKLANISGDITLAAVRDATGSSRKYALPLLEYFDSKGITRRVGDKRILMKK